MKRAYYSNSIAGFLADERDAILGQLVRNSEFAVEQSQRDSWLHEIDALKLHLAGRSGMIFLEFAIPRMGKRVDAVLVCGPAIFVIEYKVGDDRYSSHAIDQVMDYALDLKNFHKSTHPHFVAPVLIATNAPGMPIEVSVTPHRDKLFSAIRSNGQSLGQIVDKVVSWIGKAPDIDFDDWERGSYCPTPTIIDAALALYNGHSVAEISRTDAGGAELHRTTDTISNLIADAREKSYKAVCFVTGVPGAGKTLIGLNVATKHFDTENGMHSVFLSGNGPLVKILQEALARDRVGARKLPVV